MSTTTPDMATIGDELAAPSLPTASTPDLDALLNLLPTLTLPQQQYLAARIYHASSADAIRAIGRAPHTKDHWCTNVPGFREAEAAAIRLRDEEKITFARRIAKSALPLVMARQAEQATATHVGLEGQQLVSQQRAREAVAKGAGLYEEAQPTGAIERLDVIAIRLWRQRPQQADEARIVDAAQAKSGQVSPSRKSPAVEPGEPGDAAER